MLNSAILGAGNIGSRHLQGILKIKKNFNIYIVDPKNTSLLMLKKRIKEVKYKKYKKNFFFLKNQNLLPNEIELAIISTNSDVRKKVILKLIKRTKVKYLIIEKFVFQNFKSFSTVIKSLKKKKIKSWVNCPFRTLRSYRDLKKKIGNNKFRMIVVGGNWGMASNFIHYLDLFSFFAKTYKIKIFKNNLNKKIYDSKRKNFKEIKGKVELISKNKNYLSIEDHNSHEPVNILIKIKNKSFQIFEEKNIIKIFDRKGQFLKKGIFNLPFQSDLTNILVKDILIKKKSNLITLEKSSILHKKIITLIVDHINKSTNTKIINCPIT